MRSKEKNIMRVRKSELALAVAAIAAVLVLAGTLLVSRGVIDALLMTVIVAVMAGMYTLRRYARAVLLYRRRSTLHRRHPRYPGPQPAGDWPRDVTGAGGARAVHPGGVRERRIPNRT
jgi:hypothetical protein